MPCTLPPEMVDFIVDHLHDESAALKTCCVVAKSWIPRTRKHLFAHVDFYARKSHVERWKKTFLDPSNSPAHHTRSLSIYGSPAVTAEDTDVGGWIRTFRNVIHLSLICREGHRPSSSHSTDYRPPSDRSTYPLPPPSFNLVCSFPLLEDLSFVFFGSKSEPDRWNVPLRSPKLTGSLDLRTPMGTRSVARRLLDLPDGLHFTKITVGCGARDSQSITELVSRCSDTLESLTISSWFQSMFSSASVIGQYLTAARSYRDFT